MKSLTKEIKQKAGELGFTKVGIARAEKLAEEGDHLQKWLDRGYHATMEWMNRNPEKRVNPQLVLHGVKSVVSVGMNYYTGHRHSNDRDVGKISRYAWGDDYHGVLEDRLEKLLQFVRSRDPEARGKVFADTGPVMDKVWAQRAGIGWIGKHTNVITQDSGSWLFLGEILLDIELDYDAPVTDHCGSCTLCIEACPTRAITEPYVLDSGRCISYLTIEHRGEIAEELGELFDRWIYGCDICQDVCPWNEKFSQPTAAKEFQPREHTLAPKLAEWSSMTQAEFSAKFSKSPVKRTKHAGLMRNVNLALHATGAV